MFSRDHRLYGIFVFTILVLIGSSDLDAAPAKTPSAVVEDFQASLVEVMKEAQKLSIKQRFDRLAPNVERAFHLPLMVQIATAPHWKTATPSERTQLVSAFRRMSISTLATLFNSYDGEKFTLIGEKPGPQRTQLVLTKLTKSDNSTVDIAYVARKFDNGWRIIDVVVDNGISELKVRRSEYTKVLNSDGPSGLIKLLNGKADELISSK